MHYVRNKKEQSQDQEQQAMLRNPSETFTLKACCADSKDTQRHEEAVAGLMCRKLCSRLALREPATHGGHALSSAQNAAD